MKKFLSILLACSAFSVNAAWVLWAGLDEEAQVFDGTTYTKLLDWTATFPCAREDVTFRVCLNGEPLKLGYEDPSGSIPAGQVAPTIVFDDPEWGASYEVCLFMGDYDENGNWVANSDPADWQPILLNATADTKPIVDDPNQKITMEIGYSNDDTDWEFVKMAESEVRTMYSMFQKYTSDDGVEFPHAYVSGTLYAPVEDPWHPSIFTVYRPIVPEPSSAALLAVGVIMLFRKRKQDD